MAKSTGKNKAKTTVQGAEVPIKWNVSGNIITRYAGNMIVQMLENEFKISFFEINPEIKIGKDQELPKEVQADCVASVIISPNKLPSFIAALQRQYDLYIQIKSEGIEIKS